MKNRWKIVSAVMIGHLLLTGYACDKVVQSGSETAAKEHVAQVCKSADDCVVVKEDCCGCSQGGKAKAVAKSQVKGWISTLDGRCGDIMCMQVISNDPSCNKAATCQDGHCVLE